MPISPISHVIVGLGQTGVSAAHYLARLGFHFAVTDTRDNPPGLDEVKSIYPSAQFYLGGLNQELLLQAEQIIVSPGVSIREPEIAMAIEQGIDVVGDVECFVREVNAPMIAITGTNGKSTVTDLVGKMAKKAGINVQVGGNIGTPVLDLIAESPADLYVLELSSFQLETTHSLNAVAATILNVSEDHMDRYPSYTDYVSAKQRIYTHAQQIIYNRADALTKPPDDTQPAVSFGLDEPSAGQFGLRDGQFCYGDYPLMAVVEMRLAGEQNYLNALAALALAQAARIPMQACLECLTEYAGLPHRCQWLRELAGVQYYNDSKGTNVGATIAAINGLAATIPGKIILLAGGQAKDADFSDLQQPLAQHVSQCLLFGEDASLIKQQVDGCTQITEVADLTTALSQAAALAKEGDIVLLSPACASFDMFRHFAHRGDVFTDLVAQL